MIDHMPNPGLFNTKAAIRFIEWKGNTLVLTPKCASTSIVRSIPAENQLDLADCKNIKGMCIIRDPVERLEAAFRYFTTKTTFRPAYENVGEVKMVAHQPEQIEDFIDLILDNGWYDKHWVPQTWIWDEYNYDGWEFHAFEDIEGFQEKAQLPRTHLNDNRVPRTGIEYRVAELREFYKEDLALREQIEHGGHIPTTRD